MKQCLKYLQVCIASFVLFYSLCTPEKIRYISTEHPRVTYYNTKYVRYANLTAKRHGRDDPFYYVGFNIDSLVSFNNNVTVDFYFYEFLSNRYRRGFVEMHFKFCDLIHKDKFFGSAMKQGKFDQPCPYSPGQYCIDNVTIPLQQIPKNFPFTKGRIYCNVSATDHGGELIGSGYIDMEIKEAHIKRMKNKNN